MPTTKTIARNQQQGIIDNLMMAAAIIHPLTAAPQVYAIYTTHDVTGISLWTWVGFMILGTIFLIYGICHKLRPYILAQVLWFVVDFLVVLGILIYR